jgi:curved DNA-binding protein CbpA
MTSTTTDNSAGYVNYYEILGLAEEAQPGEVRKTYKKRMKALLQDISSAPITPDRRDKFLLEMAQLNAALFILRDRDKRENYWNERKHLINLEQQWSKAEGDTQASDRLRKSFEAKLRDFLSVYVEEVMLEAGRDKECVEASNWSPAYERHATQILRRYRHGLHHTIQERLPYYEVTRPKVDWEGRRRFVEELLAEGAR